MYFIHVSAISMKGKFPFSVVRYPNDLTSVSAICLQHFWLRIPSSCESVNGLIQQQDEYKNMKAVSLISQSVAKRTDKATSDCLELCKYAEPYLNYDWNFERNSLRTINTYVSSSCRNRSGMCRWKHYMLSVENTITQPHAHKYEGTKQKLIGNSRFFNSNQNQSAVCLIRFSFHSEFHRKAFIFIKLWYIDISSSRMARQVRWNSYLFFESIIMLELSAKL